MSIGLLKQAARSYSSCGQYIQAAQIFEQLNEDNLAAEAYYCA